jgi:hypothetical protein
MVMLGWATPMPMGGCVPLAWGEIYAFGQATERISNPWEYELVHTMSDAYVAGLVEGRNLLSIPPMERD